MENEQNYLSDLLIGAQRIDEEFVPDGDPRKPVWERMPRTTFETSYEPAMRYPESRTQVTTAWSPDSLYVGFWCKYTDLNLYDDEDLTLEKWELWNRDVVEVFINPFPERFRTYYEFEVAPNNQWIDLAIDLDKDPFFDASWDSGFLHECRVDAEVKQWFCEMQIPVSAFGLQSIRPNSEWRINFYRCDGLGDDSQRKFLAWSPTFEKNFHVPYYFGRIVFVEPPSSGT